MAVLYSLYSTCVSSTRNSWKHLNLHALDCSSVRNNRVQEKVWDVMISGKKLGFLVSVNASVCIVRL
jgi:hypothetical protein